MKNTITLAYRWPGWRPLVAASLCITMIAAAGAALAAKGGIKGPPTGGESANNLSLPAIQTESSNSIVANWSVPSPATLGTHYSYGCAAPQSDGQFNYPNTSCVDDLANPTEYYTGAQCVAAGFPCEGYEVSRIYWQKVDAHE